ncbi:MAG: hypothetical protein IPN69_10200 [Acidobacteria bacterium]|nr:hypothetical protein [Acidobacteriota bacterium]
MRKSLLILTFMVAAALHAFAHKYHTSLTRIDYNAAEKNLEVSIRLFVHDLTPMLERRLKKQVDPAKTPEVDTELAKYIAENFVFRKSDESNLQLKWVGKEFENDVLFVFVEAPFEGDPLELRLQNTIFFDYFEEQSNLVVARFGGKKFDLAFRVGDKVKAFAASEEGKKTAN